MYRADRIVITTPTIALVEQLANTIQSVTGEVVGRVYTREKTFERITVACHNSISLVRYAPDLWIADEAHKTECQTVKEWEQEYTPKRRIGFSATPWRNSDRESVSLFDSCIYEYGPREAFEDGVVVMPRLVYHGQEGETIDQQCVSFIMNQDGPGVCNANSIEDAERFAEKFSVPKLIVHSKNGVSAADACDFLSMGGHRLVVYVNMLAEGFDCPCIEWLVARRPVRSRVRFAQEIGRGLRAHPGKTECLVFDPHRLFQRLSLSYEACLGELPPQDEVVPELKLADIGEDIYEQIKKRGPKDAKFHALAEDYLHEVRCELQFRGIVEMKLSKASAKRSALWRSRQPTPKQIAMCKSVAKEAGRYSHQWPERIRTVLRMVWPDVPFMSQGAVSDLIEILLASSRIRD